MKNAIRILALAFFLLVAGSTAAEAQTGQVWWAFTYQTALATGDTKSFTDDFSWRNVGLEGRSFVGPNVSVGAFFGWNVLNSEVDGTVSLGPVDASGYQSRFINAFPMLVTAHYYLGERYGPRPYVGAGVGTYYIENRLEMGLTALTVSNWHFGFAPEVGVMIPTGGYSEAYLSAKYNYAASSGDITRSYWTFGLGFGSGF